jgi:hypothetical protein
MLREQDKRDSELKQEREERKMVEKQYQQKLDEL